jgi:hypothetical protein
MAHFAGETGHLAKHDDLDTYVAANPTPSSGTISARPTAGSVPAGQLYFASDDNGGTLYRTISGAWVQQAAPVNSYGPSNANLYGSTPAAVASAGSAGSSTAYAKGDHVHSGVTSVATRTGAVTLTAADVAAGTFPAGTFNFAGTLQEGGNRVYSAGNAPPYPVTSVATRTGAVTLTAADIAAGTFPGAMTFTGAVTVNNSATVNGNFAIIGNGTAGSSQLRLHDTNNSMSKYLRSNGGTLEVINNAYTVAVFALTDTGDLSTTGSITGASFVSSGGTGTAQGNSISAATNGSAALSTGSPARTGYLTFWSANGTRQGYIGYSSSTGSADAGVLNYVASTHAFSGNLTEAGQPVVSGNSYEYAGTGSTQTTTSTSYVIVTSGASGTFVAPPSGNVQVSISAYVSGSASYGHASYEIKTGGTVGSGTIIVAGQSGTAVSNSNGSFIKATMINRVNGLTPGATYNIRALMASGSSGSTCSVANTYITIVPMS